MKKVNANEMRNLNGGWGYCPGCGKWCVVVWIHGQFCWKYKASKVKFPGC